MCCGLYSRRIRVMRRRSTLRKLLSACAAPDASWFSALSKTMRAAYAERLAGLGAGDAPEPSETCTTHLTVVDAEGNDVPDGTPGEIVYRSPQLCEGYWDKPEETAEAFRDGWFRSGDLAVRDADGYHWITGRVDDVINVSGHRIGTAEVESALVAHPKVAEAAVEAVAAGRCSSRKGGACWAHWEGRRDGCRARRSSGCSRRRCSGAGSGSSPRW